MATEGAVKSVNCAMNFAGIASAYDILSTCISCIYLRLYNVI